MVSAIIHQLTRNVKEDQIKGTAFEPYFVDHTTGVYPVAASGVPNDMKYVGIKGDPTGNKDNEDGGVNDYVDIAYFAVCDSWTEVAQVAAGETSVIFTAWSDAIGYDEQRLPNGTALAIR